MTSDIPFSKFCQRSASQIPVYDHPLTARREPNNGVWPYDVVRPLPLSVEFEHEVFLVIIEVETLVVVARLFLDIWTGERTQMRSIMLSLSVALQNKDSVPLYLAASLKADPF
jgi:hypothetical protein